MGEEKALTVGDLIVANKQLLEENKKLKDLLLAVECLIIEDMDKEKILKLIRKFNK